MAGLLSFSAGGLAFLLLGSHESLSPLLLPPSAAALRRLHSLRYYAALLLSLAATIFFLLSISPSDPVSLPLQLSSCAAASLFLLYALAGLLRLRHLLPLPSPFLDFLLAAAFLQELLFLSLLQRVDPPGIENRYRDLLQVPVLTCAASSLLAASWPGSPFPPLARGVGLALHGTWLVQMGFSFFSTAMAHGCSLHERSRGNYTIKCKGHMEYHRGRAIATLQFNCHLAFLVVVAVGVCSAVAGKGGNGRGAEYSKYRPLEEMSRGDGGRNGNLQRFTLDSDEDDEEEQQGRRGSVMAAGEIVIEAEQPKQQEERKGGVGSTLPEAGVNGFREAH